ncbi:MAG: T9SS type A sorting domain-containing protein, partial [Elusimicrobiota bacterium]|nr:T9SS type A sorting domain-containing protein [Elusimicrobiota bacterium]
SATFTYFIPEAGKVSIKLYNVAGEEADTITDANESAGEHSVSYNSEHLPRGVYYYRLTVDGKVIDTKRAVVLK